MTPSDPHPTQPIAEPVEAPLGFPIETTIEPHARPDPHAHAHAERHGIMEPGPADPEAGAPADAVLGETLADEAVLDDPVTAETLEQKMNAALERCAALESEAGEMRNRWMRAEAELANIRNRSRREVDDARNFAVQSFARDVVEAADNIRRGLDSLPPSAEGDAKLVTSLRDGFSGVERSFIALLERNGITREDPTGTVFDANRHQAMAEQPSAEHPPGIVLQAWSQAWLLNGRLLRPAMVVVSRMPDPEGA